MADFFVSWLLQVRPKLTVDRPSAVTHPGFYLTGYTIIGERLTLLPLAYR